MLCSFWQGLAIIKGIFVLVVCVLLFNPAHLFLLRHQLIHDINVEESRASRSQADFASSVELEERQNNDYLSYNDAVAKGKATLAAVDSRSNQASAATCEQFQTVTDLENNGWSVVVEKDQTFPPELEAAFKALGLPTGPENVRQTAKNDKPFENIKGVRTNPVDRAGGYTQFFNPKRGILIAQNNVSPSNKIQDDRDRQNLPPLPKEQLAEAIPKVSRWSDVVWIEWVDAARKAGEDPGLLTYIFRCNTITRSTVGIIKKVLGNAIDHELPFPGKEFSMRDEQAMALLGTVHGQGVARLLIDHRDQISSTLFRVYVWTRESDFTEWFMLWTLYPHYPE